MRTKRETSIFFPHHIFRNVGSHFEPDMNSNTKLVAFPPTRQTAIEECPKLVSFDMLGKRLHNSTPVKLGGNTKTNFNWGFALPKTSSNEPSKYPVGLGNQFCKELS